MGRWLPTICADVSQSDSNGRQHVAAALTTPGTAASRSTPVFTISETRSARRSSSRAPNEARIVATLCRLKPRSAVCNSHQVRPSKAAPTGRRAAIAIWDATTSARTRLVRRSAPWAVAAFPRSVSASGVDIEASIGSTMHATVSTRESRQTNVPGRASSWSDAAPSGRRGMVPGASVASARAPLRPNVDPDRRRRP